MRMKFEPLGTAIVDTTALGLQDLGIFGKGTVESSSHLFTVHKIVYK